jgi:lysophospholipase L1-like esterase
MSRRFAKVLGCVILLSLLGVQAQAQTATKPAKKEAVKSVKKAPEKPRTPADALTPAVKNPERHEGFLARIKQGPVGLLFLGDSITDAWPRRGKSTWDKLAPYNPADFGISGDRTEHVLWRITHGELEGIDPKVVVIMIGTNNIGHFSDEKPEWAAAGVKKILDTVHTKLPKAKVLLLGVFPRGAKDSDARRKVEAINAIICKFGDGQKTTYLDVSRKFLDAAGDLPKDIMPDALHPNEKGYQIWYDAMLPTLEKLLRD